MYINWRERCLVVLFLVVSGCGDVREDEEVQEASDPLTASIGPTADTYVQSGANANTNFGTATTLQTDRNDGGTYKEAFLRFSIGAVGTITRARLRLFVTNDAANSADIVSVPSNTWGETTTTYNNRPVKGAVLGSILSSTAGTFVEVDVTSAVGPSRDVSFAIVPRSSDTFFVRSREASSNRPQLIIDTAAPGAGQGQWSAPFFLAAEGVHAHLLPNGKLLLFPYGDNGGMDVTIWDPVGGGYTAAANMRTNVGCSGHAFLPDGRLLVTGGEPPNRHDVAIGTGILDANIFDYRDNSWTPVPDMNNPRWYPNNTTLANGDVLVLTGDMTPDDGNPIPQVWQTASASWRILGNAFRKLPSYSFTHLAPDGRVVVTGPERHTVLLNTAGTGSWSSIIASYNTAIFRSYASSVMYDNGRVLVVGGGNPPTATAEVLDLNAATPRWRNVAPMSVARRHHNATLLPDGQVLVTGGTSASGFNNPDGAVLPAEIWNPVTEAWTVVASMQIPRLYHSTAVLLPDGRVVTTSGKGTGENVGEERRETQFYSPDYLSRGTRPTISSAPTSVSYGQTFFVGTPNASAISRVTWIRLPSVTHAFDQNQRFNTLSFSTATGGLNVTAPSNRNLCPPGHYMLFILNNLGVPAVARIVQIT
ncbi:CBM96 family carbohydrate-binding protein [Sorangium sp. So ce204]|uniref:CBM96 family carbohydrate-binding protein n=1 Tax=Sorangium sp. So ce204 TaxID=3133288 RepID=UPI003F5F9684